MSTNYAIIPPEQIKDKTEKRDLQSRGKGNITSGNAAADTSMARQSNAGKNQTHMSGFSEMLKVPTQDPKFLNVGSNMQLNATKMSGRTNNASTMKKTKMLSDHQVQDQIIKDMKTNTLQRYESDIYKNQMPQLLDRER